MSDLVWIALIAAMGTAISPVIMAMIQNRNKARERAEDFARQDAVALQVRNAASEATKVAGLAAQAAELLRQQQIDIARRSEEAARLLVASNQRVADKVAGVADKVAEVATTATSTVKVTTDKLDVIHTLVNSNMTASMQSELDAVTRELAMMEEVIDLKKAASGKPPTKAVTIALVATRDKLAELTTRLDDRKKNDITITKQIDAQQKEVDT